MAVLLRGLSFVFIILVLGSFAKAVNVGVSGELLSIKLPVT